MFNRNQLKTNFLSSKKTSFDSSQRKAETRTKIQLGGLIFKSGLADLLGIEPGEDMQFEVASLEKAAIVLGILIDATIHMNEKKYEWEFIGRKNLKYEFLNNKKEK
jgi:hypothetical protein